MALKAIVEAILCSACRKRARPLPTGRFLCLSFMQVAGDIGLPCACRAMHAVLLAITRPCPAETIYHPGKGSHKVPSGRALTAECCQSHLTVTSLYYRFSPLVTYSKQLSTATSSTCCSFNNWSTYKSDIDFSEHVKEIIKRPNSLTTGDVYI